MTFKAISKPRMTSEERRACIISTACRLFADKGFRGTTTRELAAAVGVTEPVLYEHFRTKRDLYSAIIEEKASAGLSFLAALHDEHVEGGDDAAFFNSLGNAIIAWYGEDPAFVRLLLFSSLEGHELRDLFHARTAQFSCVVSNYIRRRIETGFMRPADPDLAARAFFGMVAHYALTGVVFGNNPLPQTPKEVVREMVGIFLSGMYSQEGKE